MKKVQNVPHISEMIHHIKQCPAEFLGQPDRNGRSGINTEALVNDTVRALTGDATAPRLIDIAAARRSLAELSLQQICCWALSHPFFRQIDSGWLRQFFCKGLSEVAPLVKPEQWVKDEERAEELARMILSACGKCPGGESEAEAADRFDSVSTVKRLKVIEETKAAMERAQEIRRQMAEKAAREAANVYSRE